MHFTTLPLGTELGIIIACIGGKRSWLGSSYLLFNWQLNQNLWPSGWAFSNGVAGSFSFFFVFISLSLLTVVYVLLIFRRLDRSSINLRFVYVAGLFYRVTATSVLLTGILVFNNFYFLNFFCCYFQHLYVHSHL